MKHIVIAICMIELAAAAHAQTTSTGDKIAQQVPAVRVKREKLLDDANKFYKAKQYDKVLAACAELLRNDSKDTEAMEFKAMSYYKLADWQQSVYAWNDYLLNSKSEKNVTALNWLIYGDCKRHLKSYDVALKAFERARKVLEPDSVIAGNIELGIGETYYEMGKFTAAIEHLKAAAAEFPHDIELHYDLGMSYVATGKEAEAWKEYYVLVKLDGPMGGKLAMAALDKFPGKSPDPAKAVSEPTGGQPQASTASLMQEAGVAFGKLEFDRAIDLCKRAVSLEPKNSQAHLCLANSYYESRMFQPAVDAYAKYFTLATPAFDTIMPYADSYLELELYAKAIPLLRQAIALTTVPGEKAGAQLRLGNAYYEMGDYANALEPFRLVTLFAPANDDALYYLGMCYMRLGKKAEAQLAQKKLETMNRISGGNLQSWIDGMK